MKSAFQDHRTSGEASRPKMSHWTFDQTKPAAAPFNRWEASPEQLRERVHALENSLGLVLCVQPLATATAADLWLALGEVRRIAAESLTTEVGPTKYESKAQPGLFYWAELNPMLPGFVRSFAVVQQVDGYPATEAHGDLSGLAHFADADRFARQLAEGTFQP